MTEAVLTRNIVRALNDLPKTWAVKIHGGPHQVGGVPDILCCSQGRFIGLEVKLPGKERNLTPLQESVLRKIRRARGRAAMITTVEQALEVIAHGHLN